MKTELKSYSDKLISVIVPIYNTDAYLSKCLNSIIGQTYPFLDIILIDDGSIDRSSEICDQYARKDSRIRVFHRKNSGLVASRIFGLTVANGEYVAWVDSDDWIAPDAYEQMVAAADGCDMIWCDVMGVFNGKTSVISIQYSDDPSEMIHRILEGSVSGWLWNKLIKKSFYDSADIQLYVGDDMMEDMLHSVELLCANPRMRYVNRPLYCYNRTNELAMTAGNWTVIANKGLNNIKHIYDYLTEKNLFAIYRSDFAFLAMKVKLALLHEKNISTARLLFPYAHKLSYAYRMQYPIKLIYWLGFNGGLWGTWLITLYFKLLRKGKA